MSIRPMGPSQAGLAGAFAPIIGSTDQAFVVLPNAAAMKTWRAGALAARTGKGRILCAGTSVTYGYGATNRDTDNTPVVLQSMLAGFSQPAYPGQQFLVSAAISGGFKRANITLGTGWSVAAGYNIAGGGTANGAASAAGNLDIGPYTCTGFRVTWMRRSNTSTFDAWCDSDTHTSTGGTGTDALQTTVVPATGGLGSHTLHIGNIGAGAGGALIIGVEPYVGTSPGVGLYVANAGRPSSRTGDWDNGTSPWNSQPVAWDDYQPTLTVLELPLLNDQLNNIAPASVQAAMANILTKAKTYGSVLAWIPLARTDLPSPTYTWSQYTAVGIAACVAAGVPVVDMNRFFGVNDISGTSAFGSLDSGDHVHPTTEVHYQTARVLYRAITSL